MAIHTRGENDARWRPRRRTWVLEIAARGPLTGCHRETSNPRSTNPGTCPSSAVRRAICEPVYLEPSKPNSLSAPVASTNTGSCCRPPPAPSSCSPGCLVVVVLFLLSLLPSSFACRRSAIPPLISPPLDSSAHRHPPPAPTAPLFRPHRRYRSVSIHRNQRCRDPPLGLFHRHPDIEASHSRYPRSPRILPTAGSDWETWNGHIRTLRARHGSKLKSSSLVEHLRTSRCPAAGVWAQRSQEKKLEEEPRACPRPRQKLCRKYTLGAMERIGDLLRTRPRPRWSA